MGAIGKTLTADIRRGQNFNGDPLVYNPANFQRFEVHTPSRVRPVEGRLGDKPALSMVVDEPGLHVVVYVSDVKRTTYTALDQFERFAAYEGLDDAVARHRARGLPLEGVFSEAYTRFAKSLVGVNGQSPVDKRIGLPIEIVFTDRRSSLEPRGVVLLDGKPMANAQVRVFTRIALDESGPAQETTVRTDAAGRFKLSVRPLDRVMVNVVHLREPSEELARTREVVWETLWASSEFVAPQ